MNELFEFVNFLYVYCTDFIINLANLTDLSYYEVNLIIFCLIYPTLTLGLFILFIIQKKRLKRIKAINKSVLIQK